MSGKLTPLKCTICGASIRAFRVTSDWAARKAHKKCWQRTMVTPPPPTKGHLDAFIANGYK